VKRRLDAVSKRPAALRATVPKDRHAFKAAMDDQTPTAMLPQNERLEA